MGDTETTVTGSQPSGTLAVPTVQWGRMQRGEQESPRAEAMGTTGGQEGKRQALLKTEVGWEMEEGFLMELTLKLDLEGLMILRRKNTLEAEKYPNNRDNINV